MQAFDTVTIDELMALPPTIFGIIRWKKYIVDLWAICAVVSTFVWKSIRQLSSAQSAVESTSRFQAPASGKMWLILFRVGTYRMKAIITSSVFKSGGEASI